MPHFKCLLPKSVTVVIRNRVKEGAFIIVGEMYKTQKTGFHLIDAHISSVTYHNYKGQYWGPGKPLVHF